MGPEYKQITSMYHFTIVPPLRLGFKGLAYKWKHNKALHIRDDSKEITMIPQAKKGGGGLNE